VIKIVLKDKKVKCAVCKKYSFIKINSYSSEKYCTKKLNTYLGKIKYKEVYQCSNCVCRYCNIDLSEKLEKLEIIYNDEYQMEENKYARYFMILKENKFYIKAMKYLFVAYKEEYQNKKNILNLILYYSNFLENFIKQEKLSIINLIIIDLLRQNKKFDLALKFCNKKFPKKYQKIVDFQKELINSKDSFEYVCNDDIFIKKDKNYGHIYRKFNRNK
jgi:hypothetical protein